MNNPNYLFNVGDKFYELNPYDNTIVFYEVIKRFYVDNRDLQEIRYMLINIKFPELTFTIPERTMIDNPEMILYSKRHPAEQTEA
jgi:hypothetical protein